MTPTQPCGRALSAVSPSCGPAKVFQVGRGFRVAVFRQGGPLVMPSQPPLQPLPAPFAGLSVGTSAWAGRLVVCLMCRDVRKNPTMKSLDSHMHAAFNITCCLPLNIAAYDFISAPSCEPEVSYVTASLRQPLRPPIYAQCCLLRSRMFMGFTQSKSQSQGVSRNVQATPCNLAPT